MRTLCKVVLTVAVVALVAGPALAQQPRRPGGGIGAFGGFGGRAMGVSMLVGNKSVQEELKLTAEQIEKLGAPGKAAQEKNRDVFSKLRDASREEREEIMKKLGEAAKATNDEVNKLAKDLLKEDQVKRLHQIELQVRGSSAFNDEEIQKTLKISDDQKEDLKKIREAAEKEMAALRPQPGQGGGQAGRGNFEEIQKKMEASRKETTEKIMGVLTADQKKQWKEMTGETFQIKFDQPQRRRQDQ